MLLLHRIKNFLNATASALFTTTNTAAAPVYYIVYLYDDYGTVETRRQKTKTIHFQTTNDVLIN